MIPAKILLFGEYTIIKGTQALVIPFPHFGGQWKYATKNENALERQMDLTRFADFLEEKNFPVKFDTLGFRKDLSEGLYFDSNIPTGYGLGSSGSVTAAVYGRYCIDKQLVSEKKEGEKLIFLKELFSKMESFFHGMSSGIDPLICSIQQPIWLEDKDTIQTISCQALKDGTLFLLDTKISRSTSPLVKIFLEKWKNEDYANDLKLHLFSQSNNAIQNYAKGNGRELFHSIHNISVVQEEYFSEMIPLKFKKMWRYGIESHDYKLKLCGAGGGGFILGITQDFEKTKTTLSGYNLIRL